MTAKKYRRPLVGLQITPEGPYRIPMVIEALRAEFLKPERVDGNVVYVTEGQVRRVINVLCKATPGVCFQQLETQVVDKKGRRGVVRGYTVNKYKKPCVLVLWESGPPIKQKKGSTRYDPRQFIELWRLGVNKDNQYFVKNSTSRKPPPPKPKPEKPEPVSRWDLVI